MPPIDFRGYSGDCLVHGRLDIPTEARLTDFLNSSLVFAIHETKFYALHDGRAVDAGDQEWAANELWAVEPTDTGKTPWHADLHQEAVRAVHVEIDMPPYTIRGTLHRVRGRGPIAKSRGQRRQMVPLTEAEVRFTFMGHEITRQTPVVVFNRERVTRIRRLAAEVPVASARAEVVTTG